MEAILAERGIAWRLASHYIHSAYVRHAVLHPSPLGLLHEPFGVDMDASTIPIEAGLEERAVSYTKGCYLGQEVIARIAHRGHVNRHLAGLRLEAPCATPAELSKDGKAVGSLTSVATSARHGVIGLGLVHRKHVAPGTALDLPGGGQAVVEALPFPS